MARILRLFKCAIVLFILDGCIVNFRMFSSAMSKAEKSFEGNQVVPDVVPKAPNFIANIQYPSGVFVNEGAVLRPTQVKDPPRVKWDAEPNHFYTLVMTDADVPSRIDPKIHQWHHWLVVNIPGANVGAGDELYGYVGAGPPPETGLHRYVFLVYKQPGKLIFDDAILTNATLVNRGKFYIDDFAKKHHLGDPVAGNFFQAEYDDYVPELYNQLKKKYNL